MTFEEFGLSENVMRGLDAMNFKEATPVQEQTIPVILQKRDLIACAQTGTGKTAAYILPLLNLLTEKQGDGDRLSLLRGSWRNRSTCSSRDFPIFFLFLLLWFRVGETALHGTSKSGD